MPDSQLTLFRETPWEQFQDWLTKPGARHVLRDIYAIAAPYAREWKRTGVSVSVKLLVELERHRIRHVRARAQRRFRHLPQFDGYTLNNSFTESIARHIAAHRPDWAGMFDHREATATRKGKQWALVLPRKTA